ncbi:MAG TPA: SPOR domain-containing protein [Sphingomicrobium sp.]|nr:SPOR domain-containing protein [Sphingomicrobium sp.]
MARSIRIGTALSALGVIGLLSGCATPGSRMAGKASASGKAGASNVGLATRAIAALDKGDYASAITYAERAVEHSPASAQFRALLGNSYFAGGRFASAEAAYRDSLALQGDQAPVVLKLALVTIGQGKSNEAIALLQSAQSILDPADLGLALALAGRPADAALLLDSAARQTGADARVRQNLALAHALAGDWTMARTVAAQDLPADQVEARLQQWMSFAKPTRASDQLAALTGISPAAADPGQPVRLALNREAPRLAVNEAAPSVAPAYYPPAAPPEAPAAPPVEVGSYQPPVDAAPASAAQAVAAVAPVVADEAPPEITVPAVAIAAAVPTFVPPAPVVEAAAPQLAESAPVPAFRPRVVAAKAQQRRAALAPVKAGGAVVQLGAFANRGNVESAWARYAAKHPSLRNYSPTTARFNAGSSTVYRLSVAGFASGRAAQAYCASLKRAGASCFVRSSGGDQPVRLALR